MKKFHMSLKMQAGLYVFCFTLLFVVGLIAAISFGFDRYFYYLKKEDMIEAGQRLSAVYLDKGTAGEAEFDEISQSLEADVLIVDHSQLVYTSRPGRRVRIKPPADEKDGDDVIVVSKDKDPDAGQEPRQMDQPKHIQELLELLQGKRPAPGEMNKVQLYQPDAYFQYFYLLSPIKDDVYLLICLPLQPLQESIYIVQRFIIACGLIWLLIAVIGTFFVTNRMVKPLLELKNLAVAMAHLDFSKKWKRQRHDEIGELGNSLNTLSHQLNVALTALQESNKELQKQLDKAKEVEDMRKSFLSAVSHELKTPLAIIQGYAEGLDTLQIDEATRRKYCRVIRGETEKMDKLVKDLLNLSRLETGSFRIEQTVFDFTALTEESKDRFAKAVADKQIRLLWDLPQEMNVYGDPERIDTILTNFLSNAIDYTDAGHQVRVSAREEAADYCIEVYNQGPQIPEDQQKRIWEPFYKVDASRARTNRIFGGHGLGLGIVAALVKLHGQRYGVRNESDGVTFWFTLKKA